ncbi:nuclear transport factor 2 family protein [Rhodococcoides yunnanense]|uniref:Nuclear transport factor 2 family protein n=1 Tax=Rhodococcoides yunnanense TaxID=278209 RepID=A0ABU4BDA2_9NOCA|nr:nuclear transport factor 2 family protein [Rhodococcus yunnanensis]MDV6262191.1 nuclear transport factor 2 family protein [Rhodococcus yunnanensis]
MTDSSVEDVHAIQELNARYNFAVDETDGAAWADCFTATGVFNALLPGQTLTGTEELIDFMPIVTEAFGRMQHLTTYEIITVSGNETTQKCYLLFFGARDGRRNLVTVDRSTRADSLIRHAFGTRNAVCKDTVNPQSSTSPASST